MRSTGLELLQVGGKLALQPKDRERFELTPEGGVLELGEPDILYLNDGHGRFTPESWTDGRFVDAAKRPLTAAPKDWGLSVMLRDMNGDGAPDIYVCNDFSSPDRIWINDGRGRFSPLPGLALRCTSTFSMGIDFADVNRDGYDDFLVVDMLSYDHRRRITQKPFLRGIIETQPKAGRAGSRSSATPWRWPVGDGTYAELAQLAGLDVRRNGPGRPVFLDVDLGDGYEDVLVPTGHEL